MNNPYESKSTSGTPGRLPLSTSVGLLIMRLAFGGLMMVHGIPKLMSFSEKKDAFPDPLGLGSQLSLIGAVGSEVVCAALLAVGLLTRLAAIPLAFTMAVAFLIVHGDDPWQKKELAAMYLCGYAAILFAGPGSLSLDYLWKKRASGGK